MTAVKTMQIRIVHPQAERLIADLVSRNYIEIDDPCETNEPETSLDRFDRWRREAEELRRTEGPPYDDPPLSMEEIVAIVKEVRADIYAKERKQKQAACR